MLENIYCVFFLFIFIYSENGFAEKSWENSTVTIHLEKVNFDTAKQRCKDEGERLVFLKTNRLVRFRNESITNNGNTVNIFFILLIFILTTTQRSQPKIW